MFGFILTLRFVWLVTNITLMFIFSWLFRSMILLSISLSFNQHHAAPKQSCSCGGRILPAAPAAQDASGVSFPLLAKPNMAQGGATTMSEAEMVLRGEFLGKSATKAAATTLTLLDTPSLGRTFLFDEPACLRRFCKCCVQLRKHLESSVLSVP